MNLLRQFKTWWWVHLTATAPTEVDRELAWRGYVLNTILSGLIVLTALFFVQDLIYWSLGLDSGSALLAVLLLAVFIFLFWLSRKRNIPLAIFLFSLVNVAVSFLLSLGWGVADIATNAFYVMAIVQTGLLLRGRVFVLVLGTLLLGYMSIGWAELRGWFAPPFHTELSANHISVTVLLIFLTFLGYVTSHLIDRVLSAQVVEATRRQELESRTSIAIELQMSMLPTHSPNYTGFEITGQSIPARDVGGDFYDYHQLANGELAIIIGDVTGKGIPAALLMAVTTGMIDSLIPTAAEPTELLVVATSRLQKHSQRSGLNAACLAAFLKRSGALCVANAGCIAPIVRRTSGQVEWLDVFGLPMGVENNLNHYHQVQTILTPGDMVVFTTDGVVEARNEAEKIFGFEALESIVASGPSQSAEEMKHYILDRVEAHRGSAEQNDDVTVVVVRVKGDLPRRG
ncbi:MAG: PP2C family protein-serine/threonine phosphatase [Anaerolineae bacterium]|nr:PP2C family protein-serine/threonine phosphatase [Anaerolineae bacterium]